MMQRDHDRIEELLAVRALGGLDGEDQAALEGELEAHGPDCAECRRLERELDEVAGALALALDPVPVDAAMADAILRQGRGAAEADELTARRDARRRPTRTMTAIAGVAAAVVAIVVTLTVVQPGALPVTRANLAQRVVHFGPVGLLGAPDEPSNEFDDANLAMAYSPGEPGAVFWGSDLPAPGPDEAYEIWMIEGDTPTSGGCVTPTEGRLALHVDAEIGATELMAVTVESTDCPSAPTTDPVLAAPLTTS